MSLRLGFVPTIVVSSAKIAKEVMKTQDLEFASRPSLIGQQRLSYNGLDLAFSPYNDYWREMRKICVLHLFTLKRVKSYTSIREYEGCFGKRYEGEGCERSRFHGLLNDAQAMLGSFFFSDHFPLMGWLDKLTGLTARLEKTFREMDLITTLPLISLGITLKECSWRNRYRRSYRDLGDDSINEESQSDEESPRRSSSEGDNEAASSVPLLVPRETLQKCSIDGYEIPPKTLVFVNAWAIGRDPEAWENPEEFMPERFLGSSVDFRGQHYKLIPFGAGRRVCPGLHIGVVTVELTLANLLHSFDWEMPAGMNKEDIDLDTIPGIAMHKKNALCLVAKKYN
ncbi:4-hydroxyphenylacetaldehyde oxime monooxygenase [Vitis vinifera]|uniref:4-hydroxyphenylacetaldehyde oxime monooxygenase n=1 Tax=Vitis vinifera TaxID=29760 RepID=A0A438J2T6_VITVI|nr:4-hydroxyphenylacetaldehyde oxime monooxygenase [Vitis vinifera]